MNNLYIVCDYREQFPSIINGTKIYNDHISKNSLDNLITSLNHCGYYTEYFGGVDTLIEYYYCGKKLPDGIFVNLNDGLTEKHKRGQTPLLLEMLKANYTGADVFHTLLASDKYFTSLYLQQNNILCPNSILISSKTDIKQIENISPPLIIKPNYEGSSIGITSNCFCSNYQKAETAITKLLQEFEDILVQEYISGYEITNILLTEKKAKKTLFNEALIISLEDKIYFDNEVFGIEEKYLGKRQYQLAQKFLSPLIVDKIKYTSEHINTLMHLSNYTRLDYRICGEEIYFIEVNTNPAFGKSSDVGKCCELLNISFDSFVELFAQTIM